MATRTPADSRAFRRELLALLVGFLVFFGAAVVLIAWWAWHRFPDEGWWVIARAMRWLFHALLFGLAGGVALSWPLSWLHHRLGIYRCWKCGSPRPRRGICSCFGGDAVATCARLNKRPRSRFLRHARRRIPSVLLVYILLVPPAVVIVGRKPGLIFGAEALDLLFVHGMLCVLFGATMKLGVLLLEIPGIRRRWRLRMQMFLTTFAAWPLAFACWMIAWSLGTQ